MWNPIHLSRRANPKFVAVPKLPCHCQCISYIVAPSQFCQIILSTLRMSFGKRFIAGLENTLRERPLHMTSWKYWFYNSIETAILRAHLSRSWVVFAVFILIYRLFSPIILPFPAKSSDYCAKTHLRSVKQTFGHSLSLVPANKARGKNNSQWHNTEANNQLGTSHSSM